MVDMDIIKKNTKFKILKLKSSLCDYSDVYIIFKGTITVVGSEGTAAAKATDRNNKQVIFKNCPWTASVK